MFAFSPLARVPNSGSILTRGLVPESQAKSNLISPSFRNEILRVTLSRMRTCPRSHTFFPGAATNALGLVPSLDDTGSISITSWMP